MVLLKYAKLATITISWDSEVHNYVLYEDVLLFVYLDSHLSASVDDSVFYYYRTVRKKHSIQTWYTQDITSHVPFPHMFLCVYTLTAQLLY